MDERLIERYKRLIEIALDLASTLDLDVLLKRIVQIAADLCNAQASSIMLYDEGKNILHFQASTDIDENTMRGITIPIEGSVAGWILTHREPALITDTLKDQRYTGSLENITPYKTTSLLGAPLITKNKNIGVIEVINKLEGSFTPNDQETLMVLAAQAAVAIDNTRLFQQSDLIAEMVHELRTPLSSLSSAAYLLQKPEISKEQQGKLASTIQAEALRLNELASTFLDLARLESGRVSYQLTHFDLGLLFRECINIFQTKADEKQIKLSWSMPDGSPTVKADRDKIKQVILNLISNAIKYNFQGGSVSLSAEIHDQYFEVSVYDTGIGIPPEATSHLFERFYRVKTSEAMTGGAGLGLSICKKIVEGHQGRIAVTSQPGHGTTFTFVIPLINKSTNQQ